MEFLKQDPKFVDEISEDFVCTICKKVLNDTHQAKCGCQYCRRCIENHIRKGNTFCPSKSKSCCSTKVDMTSIIPNYFTNRKIENLQIECLNGECKYVCTLSEMEDHMRSCEYGEAQCAYAEMGCSVDGVSAREMKKHLVDAALEHATLLVTWAGQLRNNVEEGRRQSETERRRLEEQIEALRTQMEVTVNAAIANERQISKDEMEKQQKNMKDDMDKLQQKMDNEIQKQQKKNDEMVKQQTKIDEIERQQKKLKEIEKKQKKMDEESETQKKTREEQIKTINNKFSEFKETLNPGEMVWKIDNLTQKREDALNGGARSILSGSFFSHLNGYKLCLEMLSDGDGSGEGDHLSLRVSIMRGPNDDIVPWPCKKRFRLQLLNMDTGESHTTHTAFELPAAADCGKKPTTERNIACGYSKFISWAELNRDASLKKNDSIIVKCSCT